MNIKVYKPENLGNFIEELKATAGELGLDADGVRKLNIERYICNLQALQEDGARLSIMPHHTQEMIWKAIYQNPGAIRFVNNPTDAMKEYIIMQDGGNIQYISEPTDEEIYLAIDVRPASILKVENYTKKHAKIALERELDLIFNIDKSLIDEEMMLFVFDLVEHRPNELTKFVKKQYYGEVNNFNSPLVLFSNEKLKQVAFEINPLFLNCFIPSELTEEQVIGLLNKGHYSWNIASMTMDSNYAISKKVLETLMSLEIELELRDVLPRLAKDCLNKNVIKALVDYHNKSHLDCDFISIKAGLSKNVQLLLPGTDAVDVTSLNSLVDDNVEIIFRDSGHIRLEYLPSGYSHKGVINMALKKNKRNKKHLNFWKTKVKKQ